MFEELPTVSLSEEPSKLFSISGRKNAWMDDRTITKKIHFSSLGFFWVCTEKYVDMGACLLLPNLCMASLP